MKGMLVHALRSAIGDSTNGGATSKFTSFVLCGEGIPEVFEASPRYPALALVRRWVGTPQEYAHAEPVDRPTGMVGPMMGGNFVHTSDSRLRRIFPYPIPVHDRFETQAQYDANFD